MRILIVEDEVHLADALSQILKKQNYNVDTIYDGEEGLDYALSDVYDIIILDLMLPGMNGLEILQNIREEKILTPVIILTAKGEATDKIKGLDYGADDYLAKPFVVDELLARIRAVLRRKGEITDTTNLKYGDIELNVNNLKLTKGTNEINLTKKEAQILEFFILRKGIVSSKDVMIEKIWGFTSDAVDNNVEVYISFLRKKLQHLGSDVKIATIRGAGYVLEGEE